MVQMGKRRTGPEEKQRRYIEWKRALRRDHREK